MSEPTAFRHLVLAANIGEAFAEKRDGEVALMLARFERERLAVANAELRKFVAAFDDYAAARAAHDHEEAQRTGRILLEKRARLAAAWPEVVDGGDGK